MEQQENGSTSLISHGSDPNMPAVLLTGYATLEANERAQDSGIPVLFKPIDIKQLLQPSPTY